MQFNFSVVLAGEYPIGLLKGLWLTLQLSVAAWSLGFFLAILLAGIRSTPFKPLQWLVATYVEYQRNVPLLVHILFWYFGVPELLPQEARDWLIAHNMEFLSAMMALGLCAAAYMSEDLRSGIRAIPSSQIEAARALGLSYLKTMRLVVMPQAIRASIPPLVSQALLLFKNSSLAMAIGLAELMYKTREIENDTFRTFEIYAICTLIYLSVSFGIMAFGQRIERRLRRRGG
ncbi:amino acid ABC transporter permease [Propionivibrio sp.]|uniref:amino acid ABC transporter permease n=1 Tax=Propionivibrio sp. TaxID=2212460 RepID=UPI0039E6D416